MSHNVYANGNEVSGKASSGKTICNTPDVCFTPPLTPATPPGVPIPYPNTGMASDATDGSSTVKIADQEVMLKNKSCFGKSSGDEGGSAPKKGVVTSRNTGKVYFNAWSMDVKVEGENVPRHLDITTHNHMSKMPGNTPPMPHVSSMSASAGAPKCEACAAAARAGNPVNPLRGYKLLDGADDLDFVLEGPLDLVWQRVYMSNLARVGFFGQGWMTRVEVHVLLDADSVVLVDREGRSIPFPRMNVGDAYFHRQEMCTLSRTTADAFRLEQSDGLVMQFVVSDGVDSGRWTARLVCLSDPNDNAVRLTWSAGGRLERVDGSGTDALAFEWREDRLSRVWKLCGAVGAPGDPAATAVVVAEYAYAQGDLVGVWRRGGRKTREFAWANHIMVRHAQPGGLACEYEWTEHTPRGKVLRSSTNTGTELRFDYRGPRTVVTDQDGISESYLADPDGHWIGFVDGKGRSFRRLVDADGHLLGTVSPSGAATRSEVDERGLTVRAWDEAGHLSETEWHPVLAVPTAETDALGRTERFSYDERGNLLAHRLPDGSTRQYAYDARGLVVAVTDPLGKQTTFRYDAAGRIVEATSCTGGSDRYVYDSHGQLLCQTDPLGAKTSYAYSTEGDLVQVTGSDGAAVRYEHDALGRLTGEIEPMGGRTTYRLRPDGLAVTVVEPGGETTRYVRNAAGQLLEIVNANGAACTLAYDEVGSIVRLRSFEGSEQRFDYSEDDDLVASEEASTSGEVIRSIYGYDAVGRPTRVATSDGMWAEFDYDAAGQLVAGRNAQSVVSFAYDVAGRRVRESLRRLDLPSALGPHAAAGFECGHDANGNVVETRISNGTVLGCLRYGSGHVHQILVDGAVFCDIERDAAHVARAVTHGALSSTRTHDDALRATTLEVSASGTDEAARPAPVIVSRHAHDLNGDMLAVDRRAPWGRERRQFRYDANRRIVDEGGTAPPVGSIRWDGASNPVDSPGDVVVDNRVRSFRSTLADYDGFGRMTLRRSPAGQVRLEWNGLHQLVGARTSRGGVTHLEQYAYDAFGRRIAKITDGREKTFLWEGERLLMEDDGAVRRVFVYHDDSHEPIGFVVGESRADASSPPAARFLYLHNDPTGSPFAMTDDGGNVLWRATLGAFGPQADESGDDDVDEGRLAFQPLRLQGQYLDAATGLAYNRFRYYEPSFGRFISPDPIGLLGGLNAYRYAPNVLSWIDPTGLHHVNQSRIDGARREATEARSIVRKGKGKVRVQRECYLRRCSGKNAGKRVYDDKGPLATGELRRLDIVVINVAKGNVMRAVEVTSKTNVNNKDDQLDKERRIRANGGLCIRDRQTGKLIKVPRVSRVVGRT